MAEGGEGVRAATRRRIVQDLDILPGQDKILVLDSVTSRVLQSVFSQLPFNMQVVEEYLPRIRAPYDFEAIYYVAPILDNMDYVTRDFCAQYKQNTPFPEPLYSKAHVLFSSRVLQEEEMRQKMMGCSRLIDSLDTLREFNMEYIVVDNRTVTTFQPDALSQAFSQSMAPLEVEVMVSRLVSLLASLSCYPNVRFQTGSPCASTCERVARDVERLMRGLREREAKPPLPPIEDTDLLVLDRSFDVAAPFLHCWTYEPMVYDYVELQEDAVALPDLPAPHRLDEEDTLWQQLQHLHYRDMAAALQRFEADFNDRLQRSKTKGEVALVAELTKDAVRRKVHILSLWSKSLIPLLNGAAPNEGIPKVMEWERQMLGGEASEKDLRAKLQADLPKLLKLDPSHRQRLLIAWLAAFPQPPTPALRQQWGATLQLSPQLVDAAFSAVGMAAATQGSGLRYKSVGEGAKKYLELSLAQLIRQLVGGALTADRYKYVTGPPALPQSQAKATQSKFKFKVPSRAAAERKRRLVVFVIGGVCREEMKIVHELSTSLNRDIILVSTSVGTPADFLRQAAALLP